MLDEQPLEVSLLLDIGECECAHADPDDDDCEVERQAKTARVVRPHRPNVLALVSRNDCGIAVFMGAQHNSTAGPADP